MEQSPIFTYRLKRKFSSGAIIAGTYQEVGTGLDLFHAIINNLSGTATAIWQHIYIISWDRNVHFLRVFVPCMEVPHEDVLSGKK
jgi:hypothetical protein